MHMPFRTHQNTQKKQRVNKFYQSIIACRFFDIPTNVTIHKNILALS